MKTTADLLAMLDLHRASATTFTGPTHRHHSSAARVFGGHIIAQAMVAATRTMPANRVPHSIHVYFISPGLFEGDITYEVDLVRDGGAFCTRRVTASQKGTTLIELMLSAAPLLELPVEAPQRPDALPLAEAPTAHQAHGKFADEQEGWWVRDRPFEVRYASPSPRMLLAEDKHAEPGYVNSMWVKSVGDAPLDPALQTCLLAYISDSSVLDPLVANHPSAIERGNSGLSSLDHTMWFHQRVNINEWLRYDITAAARSSKRGLIQGSFTDEEGNLVASIAQEGLLRGNR